MELSDILEMGNDQPRWRDFPGLEGFRVQVQAPDIPGLRSLALMAGEEVRRAGAEAGHPLADPGAVARKIGCHMALDWRGLTGAHLKTLLAGAPQVKSVKAPDEQEIPFQPALLEVLVKYSRSFNDFLDRVWREEEAAVLEDQDFPNSSPAPGITPTPAAAPAAGVSGSRKTSK